MDDRGSGWSSRPGDEDRLNRVKDKLARLQGDIERLIQILPGRLASGQRRTLPGWDNDTSTADASGRWGRGGIGLRFPPDPIGRVEEQVFMLRSVSDRLLSMVGAPRQATAAGSTRTQTRESEPAGRSRGDATSEALGGEMPTGDQADDGAGDDALSSSLDPTRGPGGSGPWHKTTPEKEKFEEEPGFGFLTAGDQACASTYLATSAEIAANPRW